MTKPLSAPSAAPAGEPCNEQMCPVAGGGYLYCNSRKGHAGPHAYTFPHTLVAGDAVPRTPEPDAKKMWEAYTPPHFKGVAQKLSFADCRSLDWEIVHFAEAYASSVTAHKEAELKRFAKVIADVIRDAAETEDTLAHKDAEIAQLREERDKWKDVWRQADEAYQETRAEVERLRKANDKARKTLEHSDPSDGKMVSRCVILDALRALGEGQKP